MRLIVNALLFQVGWFVCIYLGDVAALSYLFFTLVVHYIFISDNLREWHFIFLIMIAGTSLDTLLMHIGVFQWPDKELFVPLWLISLWGLFATTFNHCLKWLQKHPRRALFIGMVFGPLNYLVGITLTDASMPLGQLYSTLILSITWMIFLPLFSHWSKQCLSRSAFS